eukprot:gene4093-4340_t
MANSKQPCLASCEKACCCEPSSYSYLEQLPDFVVQQHLLPRLNGLEKKLLRLTCPRQRQLINQSVTKAYDWDDTSITDDNLIRLLSASRALLAGLWEVDVKRCHHVSSRLLTFLRTSCHSLKKLAPSRWTDHAALADIAQFEGLEELDLGDPDTDIITIEDLGLASLLGLAGSLKSLGLSRCRWISDAALATIAKLSKLEVLDLSHTDIGPKALAGLSKLPLLHTLNLSGCRNIDDEALQQLAGMLSLATLTLRGTMATNAGLKSLQVLPRLSHLDLGSKWELDDAGLAAVAACPQVKVLAVGSFNLVRPNLCNPKGLQKLEHLSFGGGFANKGLHLLFPLLNLKSLYVQGIDLVTDGVMRHISASQKQLQHLSLRSGYSLTSGGLSLLAPLANLSVLSTNGGAAPGQDMDRVGLPGSTISCTPEPKGGLVRVKNCSNGKTLLRDIKQGSSSPRENPLGRSRAVTPSAASALGLFCGLGRPRLARGVN